MRDSLYKIVHTSRLAKLRMAIYTRISIGLKEKKSRRLLETRSLNCLKTKEVKLRLC